MINMDLKERRERILMGIRITSINGIRIPLKSMILFSINRQNKNAKKKSKKHRILIPNHHFIMNEF